MWQTCNHCAIQVHTDNSLHWLHCPLFLTKGGKVTLGTVFPKVKKKKEEYFVHKDSNDRDLCSCRKIIKRTVLYSSEVEYMRRNRRR